MYICIEPTSSNDYVMTSPAPHWYRKGGPMIVPEDQNHPRSMIFLIENTPGTNVPTNAPSPYQIRIK